MEISTPSEFVSLRRAAAELGVPMAWLRREARARGLPCIRLGRSFRFDIDQVREHLRQRAERQLVPQEQPA